MVLDASWSDPVQRRAAEALAEATHADLVELCCTAPRALAADRLRARAGTGDPSDANAAVAAAMAADFTPWPAAVQLDTSGSPADSLAAAVAAVQPPGLPTLVAAGTPA